MPKYTRQDIERIVDEDFSHGDPRSKEYRLGAVDLLCARYDVEKFQSPPRYQMRTVQADAYWAGVERGWSIYNNRKTLEKVFEQKGLTA